MEERGSSWYRGVQHTCEMRLTMQSSAYVPLCMHLRRLKRGSFATLQEGGQEQTKGLYCVENSSGVWSSSSHRRLGPCPYALESDAVFAAQLLKLGQNAVRRNAEGTRCERLTPCV